MQRAKMINNVYAASIAYDEEFLDDMQGVFPDALDCAPTSGGVGKYIYDGENWNEIVEHSSDFYVPRGDHELTQMAIRDIGNYDIPNGTTYIDFGVGGPASFTNYALPIMRGLRSQKYVGVDFCPKALARIKALEATLSDKISIATDRMDFFRSSDKIIAQDAPALGVMNGITLTNMYGTLKDKNVGENLVSAIRFLSQLCGRGWLLLTIDTNQDASSLRKAYVTPLNSKLYLSVFSRMANELPVKGFDPNGFVYDPELRLDLQLWAHEARATKTQDFLLGDAMIHVEKDQKIHLLNSYKFSRSFFEDCCQTAGFSIVKNWSHDTGMMLYLIKDKRN